MSVPANYLQVLFWFYFINNCKMSSAVALCSIVVPLPGSPVATGFFGGLGGQTKLQAPKLKYEKL